MNLLLSHPTGNANVRAAALGLLDIGTLVEFNTTLATFPGTLLDHLSNWKPFSELKRRHYHASLASLTKMHPWRELGRIAALKSGMSGLIQHESGPFCIDAVYKSVDQFTAKRLKYKKNQGVGAVYAYEDGALDSFIVAKGLGLQCVYELPIGYWRAAKQLLKAEFEARPDWAPTLTGFKDSEAKLARKDEELMLADQIIVASQFTAKTLLSFPGSLSTIKVIPYGFPPVVSCRSYSRYIYNKPLKLLFVGSLSQRKGIANLFEAVASLKSQVELTIVGQKVTDNCLPLNVELSKHRWIPSFPQEKVLQLMRDHDVLVFPSLFEGFGLVITEAMSQGTPVITTDRTAGPDLIQHGENGWLVKAGSTSALKAAIEELLYNPRQIARVGANAIESAQKRPWPVYGRELAEAVSKTI